MSKEEKGCCCTRKCGLIAAGIVGVIFVVLGGMLVFIFDTVYETIVKNNLVIANNTEAYDAWVAPPPLYLELYIFNVTNPEEFLAGAERGEFVKPRFQELGPYVYREELKKDQLKFFDANQQQELKFRSTGKYYFEPDLSRGKESDILTTLDLIAVGLPAVVEYAFALLGDDISIIQKQLIYRTLNKLMNDAKSKILFTTTVKELLFGFKTTLLSALVNSAELLPIVGGQELPDTFGLFGTMNDSRGWYDYKIYTGKEDYTLMNVVSEYDGMRSLPYWFGKECNMINGTDGTTSPAFMSKDDRIYFFVDDLCRSMYAAFYAEVDIKGVPGWEFRVPGELFEAPANSPENECWCPDLSMEVCKYDGGLALTTCQSGAPVFMTSPHLLYAEHYLQFVEGLNPIEEEHATPLVYEPDTGICLKADKRLQINMYMEPNRHFDIVANSFETPYAFPVLWLNESYITSDADAESMVKLLVTPEEAFSITQIVLCVVGGVLLVGVMYFVAVLLLHDSVEKSDEDSVDSYKKPKSQSKNEYHNSSLEMTDEVIIKDEKKTDEDHTNEPTDEPVTSL